MRPRPFGPNDPRLGSIDRGTNCATCGEDMNECPGHFGHITLEVPVFHVGFINKIKKLLESICHNCSMIKSDEVSHPFCWGDSFNLPDLNADNASLARSQVRPCHQQPRSEATFRPGLETCASERCMRGRYGR